MAITILSQPDSYQPDYSIDGHQLSYVLDSTQSYLCSMKYIGDVYINGDYVTTIKNSPNLKDGKCVMTFNEVISDFISYDRWNGPNFQICTQSKCDYKIIFGEETDGTSDCSNGTFGIQYGPSHSGIAFNGTLQYAEKTFDANQYLMNTGSTASFLTNSPRTTQVMNCQILPLDFNSPMGGTSASDYQRASRDLWIPEINPSINRIACLVHWNSIDNESGLNARVGTGSFLTYTLIGSGIIAGDKTMMIRNDTPTGLTFSRGRNTLSIDIYNTSAVVRGFNVGCLWLINYTSDSIPGDSYLNSKTVQNLSFINTGLSQQIISTMSVFTIPEDYWFISGLGYEFKFLGGSLIQGVGVSIERLESEGGLVWEDTYSDAGGHDAELGINTKFIQSRSLFKRWTGEYDQSRLDMFVPRRSRTWLPATTATPAVHDSLINYTTYHSIYGTVSGYISGSSGGVIDIHLNRYDTGETVLSTTQSGNGTYSFIWFDDTEDLFVYAYESETRKGASKVGTMSSGFDINLSSSGGSNEFSYTWYG